MLIPYLGEKSRFKDFIIPNIPKNISTYVEPFGGMFGIYFSSDICYNLEIKSIYNDSNYLNFNLFNKLKSDNDFIELVKSTIVDKVKYLYCLNNLDILDDLELALNWLIVLTCSSPFDIGKDSWRGCSEFEIFKLKWNSYDNRFKNISGIYNLDYKEIINKYDSDSTLFYLDPPYMNKESYYINHDFNKESHIELSMTLKGIKGKFLLSYYYFDGIEDLYSSYEFKSKRTIMGTELLISN